MIFSSQRLIAALSFASHTPRPLPHTAFQQREKRRKPNTEKNRNGRGMMSCDCVDVKLSMEHAARETPLADSCPFPSSHILCP
jgi:hypothetical protein